MKMNRIICGIICMVLVCILAGCGGADNTSDKVNEPQKGNTAGQGSVQDGVQMQRPISEDFDSIGEVKRFFDTSIDDSDISSELGDIKFVTDYYTQSEAIAISERANALFVPVVKQSVEAEGFGANWSPDKEHLVIIYRVDGVQYRFIYFFADHYPWVMDEPVAEDVQVGPYTIDFKELEDNIADSVFAGYLQMEEIDVFLHIRVAGNGIDSPSFGAFDFVPLSSVGGDAVE